MTATVNIVHRKIDYLFSCLFSFLFKDKLNEHNIFVKCLQKCDADISWVSVNGNNGDDDDESWVHNYVFGT